MRLPSSVKDVEQNITKPGDMLVFVAGFPPVYGKQILYFLDKIFSERSKVDAPGDERHTFIIKSYQRGYISGIFQNRFAPFILIRSLKP